MSVTKRVEEVYRKHYRETGDDIQAWNRTLDDLSPLIRQAGPLLPSTEVGRILRKVQEKVLLEEGDPFTVAVETAMQALRRDNAVAACKAAVDEMMEVNREYMKPGEWKAWKEQGDWPEWLEEGPMLYVEFGDDGSYEGWTLDHPQYYQGHGGPVAAISCPTSWEDIRSEVGETLSQADIAWE